MTINNPASRLLEIIREGQRQKKDQQAADAWSAILNVPTEHKSQLLLRVGHVMGLPATIKSKIEQVDSINQELHLKWLPGVKASFSILNLQISWKQFIERFTPDTIYGIEICGDVLSRQFAEKCLEPDTLTELLNVANDLLEKLGDPQVPDVLRQFAFKHIKLIKNAIEEYKILGIYPIEAELERITGAVVRNPAVWIHSHKTDFGKKFWSFVGRLALVTSISVGQLQIGHEVFDALSGSTAQSSNTQSVIIINEDNRNCVNN